MTRRVNYIVKIGEDFSGSFPKLAKARDYVRSILNYNAVNGLEQEIKLLKETIITETMNLYNTENNKLLGKAEEIF